MAYKHIKKEDFNWKENELGLQTARFQNGGVIMSVVRAKKGQTLLAHKHSYGSFIYIVSGSVTIEGKKLENGDAGWCDGGDAYASDCIFNEDTTYVVCRNDKDQISKS